MCFSLPQRLASRRRQPRSRRGMGSRCSASNPQDTADLLQPFVGPNGSLWHKTYELSASKVSIRVAKVAALDPETVASSPDNLIYLEDGSELCQAKDLVDRMLNSERVRDYLAREGREEHLFFEFRWEPPSDQQGRPLYMLKLEPRAFRPIESIRVVGPIKIQVARFGMQHGRLGAIRVAWGKATIAGRDAMAVATQTPSGETKLSINVQGSV